MNKAVTVALFHSYPLPQVVPGWKDSDPLNRATFTAQERVLNLMNQIVLDIKKGVDSDYFIVGGSRPDNEGIMKSLGAETLRIQLCRLVIDNQLFIESIKEILTEEEYGLLKVKVLSIRTEDDFRHLKDAGSATTIGNINMLNLICKSVEQEGLNLSSVRVITSPEHRFRVDNDLRKSFEYDSKVVFPEWTESGLRGKTELTIDRLVELVGNSLGILKALGFVDKFISSNRQKQGGLK